MWKLFYYDFKKIDFLSSRKYLKKNHREFFQSVNKNPIVKRGKNSKTQIHKITVLLKRRSKYRVEASNSQSAINRAITNSVRYSTYSSKFSPNVAQFSECFLYTMFVKWPFCFFFAYFFDFFKPHRFMKMAFSGFI